MIINNSHASLTMDTFHSQMDIREHDQEQTNKKKKKKRIKGQPCESYVALEITDHLLGSSTSIFISRNINHGIVYGRMKSGAIGPLIITHQSMCGVNEGPRCNK